MEDRSRKASSVDYTRSSVNYTIGAVLSLRVDFLIRYEWILRFHVIST